MVLPKMYSTSSKGRIASTNSSFLIVESECMAMVGKMRNNWIRVPKDVKPFQEWEAELLKDKLCHDDPNVG